MSRFISIPTSLWTITYAILCNCFRTVTTIEFFQRCFFTCIFSNVLFAFNCFFQLNNPLPAFWVFDGLIRKLSSLAKCIQHLGVCAVFLWHLFFLQYCFYIAQHRVYYEIPYTTICHIVLNHFFYCLQVILI